MRRDEVVDALSADNYAIAMAMVRRRLDPMTDMPVPLQQLKLVLLVCASPAMTSRTLADELGVAAATMTGLIDRLSDRGLLVRVRLPSDRRVRIIEATETGRKLARDVTSFDHGHMADIVGRLADTELAALATGMAAVRRVLEDEPHQRDREGPHVADRQVVVPPSPSGAATGNTGRAT